MLDGTRLYTEGRGRAKRTLAGHWCHPSLNQWVAKQSPFARDKFKKQWTSEICRRTRQLEPIHGPVKITVTTFFADTRKRDLDNYTPKFILDGLVEAGIIDGDHSEIVVELATRLRQDADDPRTEILIERAPLDAPELFPR